MKLYVSSCGKACPAHLDELLCFCQKEGISEVVAKLVRAWGPGPLCCLCLSKSLMQGAVLPSKLHKCRGKLIHEELTWLWMWYVELKVLLLEIDKLSFAPAAKLSKFNFAGENGMLFM
eukprot:680922-Pleurochrysis_carterae.AAC.1